MVTVTESGGAVEFETDDTVVVRYRAETAASKPHVDRLALPGTRPEADRNLVLVAPHEHPWHLGLFFCQKLVDGINCWASELYETTVRTYGFAENDGYDVDRAEEHPELTQRITWSSSEGERLLEDERTVAVHASGDGLLLTWDQSMAPLTGTRHLTSESFHGKYSGLCLRCIRSMAGGRVMLPGAKNPDPNADSTGLWCDYSGPLDGSGRVDPPTVGITLMSHPRNEESADGWFTRAEPYPLVTANPTWDRVHTLEPGASLNLRWGVWVHGGTPELDELEAAYDRFVNL